MSSQSCNHVEEEGLDPMWQKIVWKVEIIQEITDLKKRVTLLEKKNSFERMQYQNSMENNAGLVVGNKICCITLPFRLTLGVLLQIICLLVCVSVYAIMGTNQFYSAYFQEKSNYKPEKLEYVADYTQQDPNLKYEMPYIYLLFKVSRPDDQNASMEHMMNNTISQLIESQNYFQNFATIIYHQSDGEMNSQSLGYEELTTSWTDEWVSMFQIYYAVLRFKMDAPDPTMGKFILMLRFSVTNMSVLSDNAETGFWLSIGTAEQIDWNDILYVSAPDALEGGNGMHFVIDYFEKVVRPLDSSEDKHDFDIWHAWESRDLESNLLSLFLQSDLLVGHWREYVEYSYSHWVMDMGGLLSLCSLVFFFFARRIPKIFDEDEHSWGILAPISFKFAMYERMLDMIKKRDENLIM